VAQYIWSAYFIAFFLWLPRPNDTKLRCCGLRDKLPPALPLKVEASY